MSNIVETKQQNDLATYNDNMLMDVAAMDHMMKVATFMAGGTMTLPQPYQKNPANCLAVVMQAAQWRMNPFAVAQKTFFVGSQIGYESQLVSAAIQQSGAVKGMFDFEWFGPWEKIIGKFVERESKKTDEGGYPKKYKVPAWSLNDEDGLGIKVSATLNGEAEPRELTLLLKQAVTRNSTLWAEDPKQQLAYLAQKRWARLYCPGVILGVYTRDELETIVPEKDVTPQSNKEPSCAAKNDVSYLTNDEFLANEPTWKKKWLRGSANGLTIDNFKTWVSDQTKKHLTSDMVDEVLLWKPEAQPQPTIIEGQATNVAPEHQDFLDGMAQQEASSQ